MFYTYLPEDKEQTVSGMQTAWGVCRAPARGLA